MTGICNDTAKGLNTTVNQSVCDALTKLQLFSLWIIGCTLIFQKCYSLRSLGQGEQTSTGGATRKCWLLCLFNTGLSQLKESRAHLVYTFSSVRCWRRYPASVSVCSAAFKMRQRTSNQKGNFTVCSIYATAADIRYY